MGKEVKIKKKRGRERKNGRERREKTIEGGNGTIRRRYAGKTEKREECNGGRKE